MLRATLYTADWILPVAHAPLAKAGMLVNADGDIERVAPLDTFQLSHDVARVDFGAAAIIPGLVNVHAHPELSIFRGLLEDLPFHKWIPRLMRGKRAAALGTADYAVAARWTCVEALRAGVTTMGATEDSGAAVDALRDAGMRGLVFLEAFGPDPGQAEQSIADLRAKVAHHAEGTSERVRIGVSPHAPYTVSNELYALVADYARSERLPVAAHAAESESEDLLVKTGTGPFAEGLRTRGIATPVRGRSTVDMLRQTGVLDTAPLLIHAVRVSADDIRQIQDAGATIAHCPVANARLGHGIAPIVEARSAGVLVGLGTDSVASNNRIDMLEEAHIAQSLQRARLADPSILPSEELLRMATLDGARVLGVDRVTGTLQTGKSADFCVIDFSSAHVAPIADPCAAVCHAARGSDVTATVVAGNVLFTNDKIAHFDEAKLRADIDAIGQRLRTALSEVS